MSERKGKKRPKSYYIKCAHGGKKAKRTNDLDVDMKGFLVTCNKYERETVREMYNILNEYADKLYGPEKPEKCEENDNDSEEEDMEKAMQKEAAEMKETTKDVRRFQNTDTKTKNLIFIRTTLDNPCELAHHIFTDIFESQVQKARYALRMLPIDATCKANVNQISETAKSLFKRDFETAFGHGLKFTSICKIRNNNSLSRTAILPCLGKIIQELNPLHTLCHDEPDLVIIVEVIRNVCCLSVLKDYFKFRKYNLHEIIRTKENDVNSSESKKLEGTSDKHSETPKEKIDAQSQKQEIFEDNDISGKLEMAAKTEEKDKPEKLEVIDTQKDTDVGPNSDIKDVKTTNSTSAIEVNLTEYEKISENVGNCVQSNTADADAVQAPDNDKASKNAEIHEISEEQSGTVDGTETESHDKE